jgi:subtilisin family serine protease
MFSKEILMLRRALAVLAFILASASASAATISFNDPGQDRQWYLDALNFGEAWAQIAALPSRGRINVAVVDSGFDIDHADLQRNLALGKGINIVNGSGNLKPVNPHGTGTIGLLAASSGNGKGITQAAWTARAIPVRVSNRSDGAAYTSDLANGIRYAADQGARIINVSYAGVELGALQNAARYAQTKGAVVFMAAGNDGLNHRRWKNHKQLVAVGSTGPDGRVSGFSSRGRFVDLVAPGSGILSLTTKDRTRMWSGTSFASPIAASVASLMLIANPQLSPWQVRNLLARTATDLGPPGRDNASGYGLVNAQAAVAAAIATVGRYTDDVAGRGISFATNDLSTYPGLRLVSQLQGVPQNTGQAAVPVPGTIAIVACGWAAVIGRPARRREELA